MNKRNLRARMVIGAAALAFGVTFSAAAFAQYGRNVNDGGLVNVPGAQPQPGQYHYYNYNSYAAVPATAYKYPVSRNVNDGGLVAEPAPGSQARAAAVSPVRSVPHYGRSPDDGGLVN